MDMKGMLCDHTLKPIEACSNRKDDLLREIQAKAVDALCELRHRIILCVVLHDKMLAIHRRERLGRIP